MKITLPIKAISVNKVWQGRRFKTKDYLDYEQDCFKLIRGRTTPGDVEIHYKFYLKNYGLTDTSNLVKPIEDIIVKAGLIEDDRRVIRFTAEKIKSVEDKIEIEIIQL